VAIRPGPRKARLKIVAGELGGEGRKDGKEGASLSKI